MDLQLAYQAAPQSAAVASVQQLAPAAAQAAAQSAFAAQIERREESVKETPQAENAKIRPDGGGGNAPGYSPGKRRQAMKDQTGGDEMAAAAEDFGEKHFIDTTA